MTVNVTVPPPSADPRAQAAFAVAAQHQASQAQVRAAVVSSILAAWAAMNAKQLVKSWTAGIAERIFVILSIGQETVASEAASYVETALRVQGLTIDVPTINALNFAGIASDGRDLEELLVGAVARSFERLNHGDSPEAALKAGGDFLTMVAATQISDAGRAADQVALVSAEPREDNVKVAEPSRTTPTSKKQFRYGWVRMLQPPSCSRCAVLAGRFYKWNEGFERHPMCDCRHIPAAEDVANDLTTNPYEYFNSLSRDQQDQLFGVANSRAIREGGDIAQIVNATTRKGALFTADDGKRYTREGTTRRGFAGRKSTRGSRILRPTPGQIYKDARGSRETALRLLREFGYIV
jgi:hypothetical protein